MAIQLPLLLTCSASGRKDKKIIIENMPDYRLKRSENYSWWTGSPEWKRQPTRLYY